MNGESLSRYFDANGKVVNGHTLDGRDVYTNGGMSFAGRITAVSENWVCLNDGNSRTIVEKGDAGGYRVL